MRRLDERMVLWDSANGNTYAVATAPCVILTLSSNE